MPAKANSVMRSATQARRLPMASDAQGERPLRITGARLPADTLLHDVKGRERLGRPYKIKILFSCANGEPSSRFLGSNVSITVRGQRGDRFLNGIVAQFSLLELGVLTKNAELPRKAYRAIVRPTVWRLTRSSHCRFFHDQSVPDIVRLLLDERKVEFRNACTRSYPKLDHCTQYRETDFNFLNRLLQREGIYYYFEHQQDGTDKLVLVDDTQQHEAIKDYRTIPFDHVRRDSDGGPAADAVYDWHASRRVVAGLSEANAFDYLNVGRSASGGLKAKADDPAGDKEYGHQEPARWYVDDAVGKRYARVQLDTHLARSARVRGRATALGMAAGGWFGLSGHPCADQDGDYLVTDVKYRMNDGQRFLARKAAGRRHRALFDCRFAAIPRYSHYYPAPWAYVPNVGPQTATVVAPDGDDFATDAHGCVKVQFHWEQFNPPAASRIMQRCWVRAAQPWAGGRWGAMFLPRKDHEVLVHFLNGDPDKPLVVGGLYNGKNKPPYVLPDAAAVSTLYTQGTGGKNAGKRNELRFNDDKLQILLYTDGNQDNYIERDSLAYVGNDAHTIVKNAHLVEAKSQHVTVGESQLTRARDVSLNASLAIVHEAGEKYVVKSELVHVKAGATLVLEAAAMLSLKVGDSFVSVTPAGVQISGPMVLLNSGGAAGSGPGGSTTAPDHPRKADDGTSVKQN
ncbi:hypothetical protein CAL12_22690 [Bordetella genomosp. 8]|uniref:Gp5/Type VI secretion system Vgr protein OB-fold domain-containing protein n=2 Tax=Bordetella genomosp. 8 TaxID=1416806 RepID=A0A1W6YQI2_9BORD|nr:hypothetical protein CAL12_22690 [Bordetella genomosp. 8]